MIVQVREGIILIQSSAVRNGAVLLHELHQRDEGVILHIEAQFLVEDQVALLYALHSHTL